MAKARCVRGSARHCEQPADWHVRQAAGAALNCLTSLLIASSRSPSAVLAFCVSQLAPGVIELVAHSVKQNYAANDPRLKAIDEAVKAFIAVLTSTAAEWSASRTSTSSAHSQLTLSCTERRDASPLYRPADAHSCPLPASPFTGDSRPRTQSSSLACDIAAGALQGGDGGAAGRQAQAARGQHPRGGWGRTRRWGGSEGRGRGASYRTQDVWLDAGCSIRSLDDSTAV